MYYMFIHSNIGNVLTICDFNRLFRFIQVLFRFIFVIRTTNHNEPNELKVNVLSKCVCVCVIFGSRYPLDTRHSETLDCVFLYVRSL